MAALQYVLDANAFIQSKRKYYSFEICPGFWDALLWHHGRGTVDSIDRVADELERGGDDLWTWAETQAPDGFFAPTDTAGIIACYGQVVAWVYAQNQFHPEAKSAFADSGRADAWLIAYAKTTGRSLVTLEEFSPSAQKRVPIPNVCREFAVNCTTPFDMLRQLHIQFDWRPPA